MTDENKDEVMVSVHDETVKIMETIVDIRIFMKDYVMVADKLSGRWTLVKKELILK